ncbi:MAG: bifunctional folylpolyglutamate synthase/dihydrofolate synthase, partial [Chromatocurvus sp.]
CATALLVAAGKRVGTYSSPHLMRYNERICIDGIPVADALIIDAFEAIDHARGDVSLSYFEFATLAALWIFRAAQTEVAVLEVGLGGRLDAVNAVDATVAVVTRVALDHQQWLGDTLDSIATEKAGIVRDGRPVVLAESGYPQALYTVATQRAAQLQRAGSEWHWRRCGVDSLEVTGPGSPPVRITLPAGLQPSNVAAALCAVQLLGFPLESAPAERALGCLVFPGRQQHLHFKGLDVILDVAHNPDAAQALAAHLGTLAAAETVAVVGVLADTDIAGVIGPVAPHISGAVVCGLPGIARSLPAPDLAGAVAAAGVRVIAEADTPARAWELLWPTLATGSRVVVFGSFHTVGGIMPALRETGVAGDLEQTWTRR